MLDELRYFKVQIPCGWLATDNIHWASKVRILLYPLCGVYMFDTIVWQTLFAAVYNWWTGLVDWTGGLDYWTDQFLLETHIWMLYTQRHNCGKLATDDIKAVWSLCIFIVPAYWPRLLSAVCVTAHAPSTVSSRWCTLESSSFVTRTV